MRIRSIAGRRVSVCAVRCPLALAVGLAILQSRVPQVSAATDNWTDGSGNWSVAANWTTPPSTHNVPANTDTVNITETDGVNRTITYDYTGAAVTLGLLTIDLTNWTGSNTSTLSMAANNLTVGTAYIGYSGSGGNGGSGSVAQSGGAFTLTSAANGIFLGLNATDSGSYTLSGSGSLVSSNFEVVGYSGTGTFTESGGTNTLNAGAYALYLGELAGSHGTYDLSNGTLNTSVPLDVGYAGNGTFNQSGGFVSAAAVSLGVDPGATGTYTLTGGTLNTTSFAVGASTGGAGTLNVSNGSLTTTGFLTIGPNSAVNLSGGVLTVGGLGFEVGTGLNWTGGTLNVTATDFSVGDLFSPSTFILNGNQSANFTGASSYSINGIGASNAALVVAFGLSGSFTQNGTGTITVGTLAAPRTLYLTPLAGKTATYTLSNPATSLIVHGAMYVGGTEQGPTGGTANFNIQSGSATIDTLGVQFGGSVNLAGGTLSVGVLSLAGPSSTLFSWVGGTLNVTDGVALGTNFPLNVSLGGSQSGNFTGAGAFLINGVGDANVALVVGGISSASFTQNGTGQVTIGTAEVPRNLDIATIAPDSATYTLNNPATSLTVHGTIYVGGNESGTTGGTASFNVIEGFVATDALNIEGGGSVILASGYLAVGVLDASHNPTGFQWTGGDLALMDGGIYGLPSLTIPAPGVLFGSGSVVANITLNGRIILLNQADDMAIHGVVSGPGSISLGANSFFTADSLLVNSLTVDGFARIRPAGSNTLRLNTLVLAGSANNWTGRLDITNNALILEPTAISKPTAFATARNQVITGGIISSGIPANEGIAVVDNATLATPFTTFGGQPVDANSILIAAELLGDANLDGRVNFADFVVLSNNFGATGKGWGGADFNNDGITNFSDFVTLSNNFGAAIASSDLGSLAAPTSVPEPSSLVLVTLASLLLAGRRRGAAGSRRRHRLSSCREGAHARQAMSQKTFPQPLPRSLLRSIAGDHFLLDPEIKHGISFMHEVESLHLISGTPSSTPASTQRKGPPMKASFHRVAILAAILAAASTAPAHATNFTWLSTGGGLWSTAGNWSPSGSPTTTSDGAIFNLNNTYTVTFDTSPTIANIALQNGSVTFALAGHTLTTSNTGSNISDANLGLTARLTVLDGHVISGGNFIGDNATDTGFLTISTGATWSFNSGVLIVGNSGNGTLTVINGGQLTTSGATYLGNNGTAFGSATVSGAGSLWTASALTVGNNGSGSLTISNGGTVLASSLTMATTTTVTASLTVTGTGSSLNLGSGFLVVGSSGPAAATFSSGATIASGGVNVGANAIANGSLLVTGAGTTLTTSSGTFSVASSGTGTLQITQGGVVNSLVSRIAANGTGIGAVSLSDPASTWNAASLAIGGQIGINGGTGTLTINAGATVNVSGTTELRNSANSALTLNGGTLNTGDFTRLGTLNFNDGTLHVSGAFTNGSASGPLNIDGNTATALPTLRLSTNAAVNNVSALSVGIVHQGAIILDSGRSLTTSGIIIGEGALSSGTVTVTGSSTLLATSNYLAVGGTSGSMGGSGVLNIGFGAEVSVGTLKIWNTDGTAVNLAGGILSLTTLDTQGNPSRLNWTAGNLFCSSFLTVDIGTNVGPSLTIPNLADLVVSAPFTNNGLVQLSSSTLDCGTFTNNGLISGSGNITGTGSFTNNGTISTSGSLLIDNQGAKLNNGTFSLANGANLELPFGISNSGTVKLDGGSISGSLTNNADGTLQGAGTLLAITQNGTLLATGGTLRVTNSFTNTGLIQLADPSANLTGGAITNNASIQGYGKISSSLTNNGTIEALGPTPSILNITGTLANNSAGLLAASTGNKILVSSGLAANTGTINLTGGTFDNNNQPLNNTGQISGFGTFRTGGSGLDNNGNITFTGGLSTINGNLTNEATRTINIKFNPAIFTGAITNNGTIKTTNTTVTFTGAYTGNVYLSDPATNIFQNNVTISPGGSMTGGPGDQFLFSGGSLTNNGTFTNGGTFQASSAVWNSGTFTQSGPQTWTAGSTFTNSGGSATFASDAGSAASSTLAIIGNAGTVHFAAAQHVNALTLSGATLAFDLLTPGVSSAIVQVAATNEVVLNGGSVTFASHSTGPASLGYYKLIRYSGTIQGAGISGLTMPAIVNDVAYVLDTHHDPGFVDVHRGLVGDSNDDGLVNFADFVLLSNNFGQSNKGWGGADFNNDGITNFSDFVTLSNNFGATIGSNEMASAGAAAGVPEPASLFLMGAGFLGVFGTRGRRHGRARGGRRWAHFTRG